MFLVCMVVLDFEASFFSTLDSNITEETHIVSGSASLSAIEKENTRM